MLEENAWKAFKSTGLHLEASELQIVGYLESILRKYHVLTLLILMFFLSSMTVLTIFCCSFCMALRISKAAVTFQRPVWSTCLLLQPLGVATAILLQQAGGMGRHPQASGQRAAARSPTLPGRSFTTPVRCHPSLLSPIIRDTVFIDIL